MQRLMTRSIVLAFATLLLGTAACGPNAPGKVPVDSPAMPFVKPDAEDLETPTDDDADADSDTATPDDSE